jgi:hypothetical protein
MTLGGETGMALHFDERLMLSQGGMVISETDYAYNAITGRLQTITVNGTAFTVGYLANGNAVQSIGTSAVGTTWTLNTSGTSDGDLQGVITIASGTNLYAAHYTYSPEKGRRPNIDGFRCVAYLVRSCSDAPAKPPAESSFTALEQFSVCWRAFCENLILLNFYPKERRHGSLSTEDSRPRIRRLCKRSQDGRYRQTVEGGSTLGAGCQATLAGIATQERDRTEARP